MPAARLLRHATDAPIDAGTKTKAERSMWVWRERARHKAAAIRHRFLDRARSRIKFPRNRAPRDVKLLSNDAMSPLFLATIEAAEEAIYNSLFRATTVTGRENRTVDALPIDKTKEILRKYGKIK